ncbi:MAG TPA: 3'-5' exonuclease, partial [Gemmatimonadales bacterium]|nr:3'-5' exonuclease [Gemmatimonadales bacterium]
VDTGTGREDGVTLMTLHTAKGLEWPVVVISGMEDGLFPLARALESPDGLEEERRLAYVGITRARDALILSWARSRRRGGDLRPGAPSRFLREIPPELVDERRTSFAGGSTWGWRGQATTGDRRQQGATRSDNWRRVTSVDSSPVRRQSSPVVTGDENQDAPRYVKGERIKHRRFGSGAILGLSGTGKDLRVSVAFDDPEVGTKQLLVAFAALERDWESA